MIPSRVALHCIALHVYMIQKDSTKSFERSMSPNSLPLLHISRFACPYAYSTAITSLLRCVVLDVPCRVLFPQATLHSLMTRGLGVSFVATIHDKHPMYLALREGSYLRLSVPDPGGKWNQLSFMLSYSYASLHLFISDA